MYVGNKLIIISHKNMHVVSVISDRNYCSILVWLRYTQNLSHRQWWAAVEFTR